VYVGVETRGCNSGTFFHRNQVSEEALGNITQDRNNPQTRRLVKHYVDKAVQVKLNQGQVDIP